MSSPPAPYGNNPYGNGPYGNGPYGWQSPDHPQATVILVLGILGLVACQVLSPFAWVMGGRALREIDASPGRYGGRSQVNAGRICGMVGTILLVLSLLLLLVLVVVAVNAPGSIDSDYDNY